MRRRLFGHPAALSGLHKECALSRNHHLFNH
jgi:hypothetical protein